MISLPKRIGISLILPTTVWLISFIVLGVKNRENYPGLWNNSAPYDPNPELCEQILPTNKLLREPVNAYTSLLFIFPSLLPLSFAILDAVHKSDTIMSKHPIYSLVTVIIYSGQMLGTFMNHSCACKFGLIVDNLFTWLALALPIFFTMGAYIKCVQIKSKLPIYIIYSSSFGVWSALVIYISFLKTDIYVQTIITVSLLSLIIIPNIILACQHKKIKGEHKIFWVALGFALPGLLFAILDKFICASNKTFGSHALYHALEAAALTMLYVYQWTLRDIF